MSSPNTSFALEVMEMPSSSLFKPALNGRITPHAFARSSLRREPLFEFFSLCLLSQKVIHNNVSSVLLLNTELLYHVATQEQRLPFHKYHAFVEDRVQEVVRRHLYRKWRQKRDREEAAEGAAG